MEPGSTPRPLVQKKIGEILYLLICSFLPCLSSLLRNRVRKSRRDLWITLYVRRKVVSILSTKAHRGSRGRAPPNLNLGMRWKWVVNFTNRPLHPLGKSLGSYWTVRQVGSRAYLDVIEEGKTLFTLSEFELRTVQPIAYLPYRLRHIGSQHCIYQILLTLYFSLYYVHILYAS